MPRNLYSSKLSDDVVKCLYREGRRRSIPMTRLADDLLRTALSDVRHLAIVPSGADNVIPYRTSRDPDAA